MTNAPSIALLIVSVLIPFRHAYAASGNPILPLPDADKSAIEISLGPGVVGEALPAPVIVDTTPYFRLNPGTKVFQVVHGPDAGERQVNRLFFGSCPADGNCWRYREGDDEEEFLEARGDGSLVMTGVEDISAKVVTRYDPPEPFLLQGLSPGDERRVQMSVRVFADGGMADISHQGELTVTYRYMGAYRLSVPAGTFDAILMKSTFSGRVGPAELEDVQYRFFARNAGLVASIENRHVSAFFIYKSDTDVAKVLASDAGVMSTANTPAIPAQTPGARQ